MLQISVVLAVVALFLGFSESASNYGRPRPPATAKEESIRNALRTSATPEAFLGVLREAESRYL